MLEWFNNNLEIDIKSGDPNRPSIRAAMEVMNGAGEYSSIILGKHYSNIRTYKVLADTYGPEQGSLLFRQSMEAQADEGRMQKYRKEIEDLGDFGGNVASVTFPQEGGVAEYLGDSNMPPLMAQKVRDLAVSLRATGQFSAYEAKAKATQDVASQYVAFHNKDSGKLLCLIPKSDYQELISGEQTNEDLNDALTSLRDGASQVQYDEYQHKFIVRDYGEVNAKVFTLSDLKKEALGLHNYHKELAEEEEKDQEED